MAGTGKGVLRVAIEDFLETFDLPKLWFGWAKKIIEKFEDEALDNYEEMAKKLGVIDILPEFLSPSGMRSSLTKRPTQIVPILIALGMMVLGFLIGVFQPIQRLASYKVDKIVHSGRPSPFEAWAMAKRGAIDITRVYELLKELGFTDELIRGYQDLSSQFLTLIDYVSAYRRGFISLELLYEKGAGLGITADNIKIFLNVSMQLPGVQDLIRMSVREAFSPEVIAKFNYGDAFPTEVLQYTAQQGLSDDWVRKFWYAHWELPSPQQGYEMLHRLRPGRTEIPFTDSDLDLLLRTADYAPYFRDRLKAISYNPITRVDVRRMYKLGIFQPDEVKERYMDIGYSEKDAENLRDFTIKYESGSSEDKDNELKSISENLSKRMFMKGIISREIYKSRLIEIKYTDEIAELIIRLSEQELIEDMTPDFRKQYINDMITDIEKAYSARMITKENATINLSGLGLNKANIDFIIKKEDYQADLNELNSTLKLIVDGYTSGSMTRDFFIGKLGQLGITGEQQNKVIKQVEEQLAYRSRRLTEAQYRAALLKNIISLDDYRAALVGLGYSDYDIDLLIALYANTE